MFICIGLAPNIAPENFRVLFTSSTTIEFSWRALSATEANGIVQWYIIVCNETDYNFVVSIYMVKTGANVNNCDFCEMIQYALLV